MKDAPKRIYLNLGDDIGPADKFSDLTDVTWCRDEIHESDICYIRADKVLGMKIPEDKKCDDYERGQIEGYNNAISDALELIEAGEIKTLDK